MRRNRIVGDELNSGDSLQSAGAESAPAAVPVPPPWSRLDLLFGVLLPAAVITAFAAVVWPYEVDDAFILLRYGRNLATGHGLTFNPGLPPVEAYSNFISVVVAALAIRLGLAPLAVLKLIGTSCAVACPATVFVLCRQLKLKPAMARGVALLSSLAAGFTFWSVSGLETSCAALALAVAVSLLIERRPALDTAAALVLVLLSLARPEGPVFAAALWFVRVVCDGRRLGLAKAIRNNLSWGLLFAFLYGGYFAFRYAYFGVLFPNPVYFKSAPPASSWRGSMSVDYFVNWWPFLLGATAAAILRLRSVALVLTPLAVALVVYGRSHHFVVGHVGTMAFFDRYFMHVLPLLMVAAAVGVSAVGARLQGRRRVSIMVLIAAFLVSWQLAGPSGRVTALLRFVEPRREVIPGRVRAVADYINERFGQKACVATGDVGRLGWAVEGTVLDTFGLTSSEFTHTFHRDIDRYVDWVIDQRPDCFVLLVYRLEQGWKPAYYSDIRILADNTVRNEYRLTQRFGESPDSPTFCLVLERLDTIPDGSPQQDWWVSDPGLAGNR